MNSRISNNGQLGQFIRLRNGKTYKMGSYVISSQNANSQIGNFTTPQRLGMNRHNFNSMTSAQQRISPDQSRLGTQRTIDNILNGLDE